MLEPSSSEEEEEEPQNYNNPVPKVEQPPINRLSITPTLSIKPPSPYKIERPTNITSNRTVEIKVPTEISSAPPQQTGSSSPNPSFTSDELDRLLGYL